MEKGGPTIPLGRQIELEVKLEDGTIFRHPKKEGIPPNGKHCGKKCVQVYKQGRCEDTGKKFCVACRRFYYETSKEHRVALSTQIFIESDHRNTIRTQ